MKRFLFALFLALSSVVGVQGAWAVTPSGHRFCEDGVGTPDQLARKMEASLAADPTGRKALEGCRANPLLFLQGFQQTKSGQAYGLTSVKQLSPFLRRMVAMKVDNATSWRVSCLWETGAGLQVKMDCEDRQIEEGEIIYGDPVTRELLIMGRCANPGVKETPPIVVTAGCLEIRFPPMRKGAAIRFAYIGPKPLPGICHKYQLAGETQVRLSTPEECPDTYDVVRGGRKMRVVCTWDAVEEVSSRDLGYPVRVQNVSGSFYARVPEGINHWFLPVNAKEGMAAICWEDQPGHWVTLGVKAEDYVDGVATITPEQVRTLRYAGN